MPGAVLGAANNSSEQSKTSFFQGMYIRVEGRKQIKINIFNMSSDVFWF